MSLSRAYLLACRSRDNSNPSHIQVYWMSSATGHPVEQWTKSAKWEDTQRLTVHAIHHRCAEPQRKRIVSACSNHLQIKDEEETSWAALILKSISYLISKVEMSINSRMALTPYYFGRVEEWIRQKMLLELWNKSNPHIYFQSSLVKLNWNMRLGAIPS